MQESWREGWAWRARRPDLVPSSSAAFKAEKAPAWWLAPTTTWSSTSSLFTTNVLSSLIHLAYSDCLPVLPQLLLFSFSSFLLPSLSICLKCSTCGTPRHSGTHYAHLNPLFSQGTTWKIPHPSTPTHWAFRDGLEKFIVAGMPAVSTSVHSEVINQDSALESRPQGLRQYSLRLVAPQQWPKLGARNWEFSPAQWWHSPCSACRRVHLQSATLCLSVHHHFPLKPWVTDAI